ncbi:MAG: peptidoglycan/LPS O-acetylase OafA/YrhL [Candidatus Azotimanducaceae bacterium]|jgi:peptidoglycan/LPS O-acetylase OafA/YrhL
MSKPRDRFYDVDGLRFLAAIVVVLYHYTFRGNAADGLNPMQFNLVGELTRYGYLGVDLFFMISGFVILMSAGHGNWGKFIISRFVRIYPVLWVSILITGLTMYFYGEAPFLVELKTWFLNLFLVGSYVGVPYLDSVYWSLLVELKFYFLIFIALILGWIGRVVQLLSAWLLISLVLTFSPVHIPYLGFFFFPEWSHYFIAGSLFYLIRKDGIDVTKALLLAVSYGLSVYYGNLYVIKLEAAFHTGFSNWFVAGAITSFYVTLLLIGLNKLKRLNMPWMLQFGALTYPLYLLHQNIGYIIFNIFHESIPPFLLLAATIALITVLSYLIVELSEKNLNPFFKKKSEALFDWLKLPR